MKPTETERKTWQTLMRLGLPALTVLFGLQILR